MSRPLLLSDNQKKALVQFTDAKNWYHENDLQATPFTMKGLAKKHAVEMRFHGPDGCFEYRITKRGIASL